MTKMQLVNDINAPWSVSRQAESPLLRDLVNDMNALWSMTWMQGLSVNHTQWSMTKMQLVNDINVPWSVSRQAESPLLRDLVNDMNAVD